MADITMCHGDGCEKRDKCYRYTAHPDRYMQSYFAEVPWNEVTRKCKYFWNNTPNNRKETT
jgi:hypothetical protein